MSRPRRVLIACAAAALLASGGGLVSGAASPPPDQVNLVPAPPAALPVSATEPPSGDAVSAVPTTVKVAPFTSAVKAGVAVVDATWHVGASAGQYAGDPFDVGPPPSVTVYSDDAVVGDHGVDPALLNVRRVPSHGIESRDDVRALVVQGTDGTRMALVKDDLYIPQDLLNQRAAVILKDRDAAIKAGLASGAPTGIDDTNMMVAVTHSHSSPYYSSPSWGVWTFQDVFDLRFFEFMAQRIAAAVVLATDHMVPVRIGGETVPFDYTQRHSFGPATADDGTPAGYPKRDNDLTISVLRFDDITDRAHPKPLANFMTLGQHPEMLEGNNLITGEFVVNVERMADAATGAVTVFAQNDTGSTEPDRNCEAHACAVRAEFSHREYAQTERAGRQIANAVTRAFNEIGTDHPSVPQAYARYRTDFPVGVMDREFAPPVSHPYPSVSNCRTQEAVANGDPGIPIVGLPDCERQAGALFGPVFGHLHGTPADPGVTYDKLRDAGVPIPANYGAPSYTGLEETIQVHLQAFRLGEVLLTVCPCEQWADQSRDIKSRADKVPRNIWLGWDWTTFCRPAGEGRWTCPKPEAVGNWDGDPAAPPPGGTVTITDDQRRLVHAQVTNDAVGWDDAQNAATAESEPHDTTAIKGNYTHTELSATNGYDLVVPIGMANDYWGYIPTYREYQRGDHYRKALAGLGAHSSDWLATRLVAMGGALKGDAASVAKIQYSPLDIAYQADGVHQEQRARILGADAQAYLAAYERTLPPDGGTAALVTQPADIRRFDATAFTWVGGSNYTDHPVVTVQREKPDGSWEQFGDMQGDVVLTLDFPDAPELATYATGSYVWKWTAHFEAFDSDIDTGRGRQTPAGTYRFVVHGEHRGGSPPAAQPYALTSSPFSVKPWDGITVPDIRVEPDGTVSFTVGPTTTKQFDTRYPAQPGDKLVPVTVGPIDYPDTWAAGKLPTFPETGSRLFPRVDRTLIGGTERYCFSCSFRPWTDVGQVARARVQIGTRMVTARLGADGRWHTKASVPPGASAVVPTGAITDTFGEMNGAPSMTVSAMAAPQVGADVAGNGRAGGGAPAGGTIAAPASDVRHVAQAAAFGALALSVAGLCALRARCPSRPSS